VTGSHPVHRRARPCDDDLVRTLALVALIGCGGHSATTACQPSILYLDRAGGMYDHGATDSAGANRSVLLDGPRQLPGWPRDDAQWAEVVSCIAAALAPFPIDVTEDDPGASPHVELVFTTTYWAEPSATTMIVPDGCGDDHQLEFVFADALPPTPTPVCQIAIVGYAEMTADLTLDDNCQDLVNLAQDCSQTRSFVDATASCVDDFEQPAACRCGGTTEDTYQAMVAAHPACD